MGSFVNQPDFAVRAVPVTPNDEQTPETNLHKAALYIGESPGVGTGILTVVMPNELNELETITFRGLSAGMFLPICVDYVLDSGTTVDRIIAYW